MGPKLQWAIERAKRATKATGVPHYAVRDSHGEYTYVRRLTKADKVYWDIYGNKHINNPGRKRHGFKVKISYHTWGGSQPYYLHTEEGGVILVKSSGEKYKPTIYSTKLDAISAINSFMRVGRDITGLSVVKV